MKFGLKLNTQFTARQDPVKGTQELLDQVRAARDNGFDSVWVSQHYLATPYLALQTWPMLGRVVAEAGDMVVGTSIFLFTLLNPVYAAEHAATMDILTGGRFVFGIGLGYRPEEFEAFGVSLERRGERFEECLDVMLRLWTEPEVDHHGTYFSLTNARLTLRPVQRPHPPVWMAASGDAAVRRAARYGFPWLVNPHASLTQVAKQRELYLRTLREHGHDVPEDVPVFKEMSIAKTRREAIDVARPFLENKYKAYATWGLDKPMPKGETLEAPFEELAKDRFILGTPQECSQDIARYRDVIGATHLLLRLQWPGMPQQEALRQIELIGSSLIPQWRTG
jgi:alkanesulfonate monooxygenase SsuD/methylene tetrahydromethanopterin reductase-like flavin-dependent oxidoreductase (luciferase family)